MFNDDNSGQFTEDFTVQDALAALPLPPQKLIPQAVVLGFSDLLPQELDLVRPVWEQLPDDQRAAIMERLADSSEADYALDYSTFAHVGYDDPVEEVRLAAVRAGWTDDSVDTLHILTHLAASDRSDAVRAAALSQMGQYIYMGEIEEISKTETAAAEELALDLASNVTEAPEVRRRALEAIAHTSRPEVNPLIEEAFEEDNLTLRAGALNAMGNTCDERWSKHVLESLESPEAEIVFEAATAAGSIGIKSAVPMLAELGYSDDEEIQEAVVWALGEIASDEALEALQGLADHAEAEGNEDLLEAVEDALANAEMMVDMEDLLDMMDGFDGDEEEGF